MHGVVRVILGIVAASTVAGCESPTEPARDVAGTYSIQFNASSSCRLALPANARTRSYGTVVVTQSDDYVTMTVTTAVGTLPMLIGVKSGAHLSGALQLFDSGGYQIIGEARFSVGRSGLANGTLNGAIFSGLGICSAADHQLTVARR